MTLDIHQESISYYSNHKDIFLQEITDHHGSYGIDSIMMAKIKIHKHYKGKNQCKGSDRIITAPLDKTLKDNKIHYH